MLVAFSMLAELPLMRFLAILAFLAVLALLPVPPDFRPAPSFTLPTQKGERRTLEDYLARGPVLLVFHRGTW